MEIWLFRTILEDHSSMQTESKGKVYECLHCWPRWHDLIKWNICAAYVLMSDTRPRPGLQITVVCQRVAFQTKSVLVLMSREEQCGWAEAQAGYWVKNRARLEGGTQQLFRDATFGMECTHPDILETSQRKNNWASLVTVVNFSQVHQGLGWQQLWLSGEQHTEEKGRRKMALPPAASGPRWELAPMHRVCLRLPISASSRTWPPLRSTLLVVTTGQWGRAGGSPWAVLQPWGSCSCSGIPQGHHALPEFEQGMDGQGSRGLGPPQWGWVSLHFTDGKYQGSTLSYKERSYCEKMLSEEQKQTAYSCLD